MFILSILLISAGTTVKSASSYATITGNTLTLIKNPAYGGGWINPKLWGSCSKDDSINLFPWGSDNILCNGCSKNDLSCTCTGNNIYIKGDGGIQLNGYWMGATGDRCDNICGRIQRYGQTFRWITANELNSDMPGYCNAQNDWPCATWTPKFQRVSGDTYYLIVDSGDINSQGNCYGEAWAPFHGKLC